MASDQLNGGHFIPLTNAAWSLIEPYHEENARLFDISLKRLLSGDGCQMAPLKSTEKSQRSSFLC